MFSFETQGFGLLFLLLYFSHSQSNFTCPQIFLIEIINLLFSINCNFLLQYNTIRTLVGVHVAKDYEFSVVCFNDAMTTGVAMILMNKKAGTGYLANLEASSTMFLGRGMDGQLILHGAPGRKVITSPDLLRLPALLEILQE